MKAFDIELTENFELQGEIERVKFFEINKAIDLKRIIFHAIATVHTIVPSLFRGYDQSELVIYFGRAGATPDNVINRWKSSLHNRNHRYGVILGKCLTSEIRDLEADVLKIFNVIDSNNGLCIKRLENLSMGSNGQLPNSRESILYLTWDFDNYPGIISKLSTSEMDQLSREIQEEIIFDLSNSSIKEILKKTRDWGYRIPLKWHNGHLED